jgi:CheY-like chemotaxis protein
MLSMSSQIMIVDDDPVNNLICEKILQFKGVSNESISFTNAKSALHYLQSEKKPSAILLDLNLPIMDGWGFLEELKKLDSNIPIFILTSSVDPHDKEKSFTYQSVKGFFSKPLADQNLNEIKKILKLSA